MALLGRSGSGLGFGGGWGVAVGLMVIGSAVSISGHFMGSFGLMMLGVFSVAGPVALMMLMFLTSVSVYSVLNGLFSHSRRFRPRGVSS